MEELRVAAQAYYNNSPKEVRDRAWSFFCAMDKDRDGAVSFAEVNDYFQRCGYNRVRSGLFVELDHNRDGSLDFWEVLTLYYIVKTRDLWCDNCRSCLRGLYFTCSYCFDSHGDTTYDLCPKCYRARRFQHRHDRFVDSYMLLRQMKQTLRRRPDANPNQAIVPAAPAGRSPRREAARARARRAAAAHIPAGRPAAGAIVPTTALNIPARTPMIGHWTAAVQAVQVAVAVASLITSCSIM